ncbi:MAG: zf-TFIIB domain-containing protein [Chloroflexota bacterium]
MLCPHCQIDLTIADRQGVEIDFCPSCRGVWLDRGELDKLVERSIAVMSGAPPRGAAASARNQRWPDDDHDDVYDDDDDRHRRSGQRGYGQPSSSRRKKSWLSDLFDFD